MITLATILVGLKKSGNRKLIDQRILFAGAGTAATGIGMLLVKYMMMIEQATRAEALANIFFIDSKGLVYDRENIENKKAHPKKPFLKTCHYMMENFDIPKCGMKIFADKCVELIKPTILIGVSSQKDSFHQEAIEIMSQTVEHPIILPLSNPHSKCECIPADAIKWSKGKAFLATGSPFENVEHNGNSHVISQCNNAFIFPGLTLALASV